MSLQTESASGFYPGGHNPLADSVRGDKIRYDTGIRRYADSISILAIRDPAPRAATIAATVSIEQREGSMPSLTLRSGGNDRSVIRRHLPGACPLGTTPIQLWWTCHAVSGGRGPIRRPSVTSLSMYAVTTACCAAVA